jgi:urease accessory protein
MVDAHARITAVPDGRGGTALPVLAGDGPLALRRTRSEAPGTAAVCVVGAMAAPLGGDRLRIEVRVEPGARLRVTSAAATVSLPGGVPAPARYELDLEVGEGAVLEWLPEPLIAAAGSELHVRARLAVSAGARLLLREEQVLGRAVDAEPGVLHSRLTVRQDRRLLLDQATSLGPGVPGWAGAAVAGEHRALGQLLTTAPVGPVVQAGDAAAFPLAGSPLTLVTALAPDGLALRQLLDAAGSAWSPATARTSGSSSGWAAASVIASRSTAKCVGSASASSASPAGVTSV